MDITAMHEHDGGIPRNDDSAMFSLATLVGAQDTASTHDTTEDSGLIDLNALSAATGITAPAPTQGISGDLFAAPPLAAPAPAPAAPVAPKPGNSQTMVIAGLGAAAAMLAVSLGVVMARQPAETAAAPVVKTVVVHAPAPAVDPAPRPAPEEEPAVAAAPSAAPSAASAKPGKVARRTTRRRTTAPLRTNTTPKVTKPPVAKPVCRCAPSDLMCNMRCATKK